MKITFNNPTLEQLFFGKYTGKPICPDPVLAKFKRKMLILAKTDTMRELSRIKGLNLEALKGDRSGSFSIRIDLKYRLIFRIEPNNVVIAEEIIIDELSNHYK